jgi:Zn-dependent M28 family amino/carboxypeptidase
MTKWTGVGLSLLAAGVLSAAACSSDDTVAPEPTGVGAAGGSGGAGGAGGGIGGEAPDPCQAFDELVTRDALRGHLEQLEQIATDNDGNRAASTPGWDATIAYVQGELDAAGHTVSTTTFDFPNAKILGPGVFEITAPTARTFVGANFNDPENDPNGEFTPMGGSVPGDVTAELVAVDLAMGPGNTTTSGCQASDFDDGNGGSIATGKIALIQRGDCLFVDKLTNAEAAGAVGVIIFNQGDTTARRGLIAGGLGEHSLTIPAIFATTAVAEDLNTELGNGAVTVHVVTDTVYETSQTNNLVLEIPGASSDVIMFGAHLDGVQAGPGINDNGTGSSALLEIAKQLQQCSTLARTVRFAWWGAEELGLLGSEAYVAGLSSAERSQIVGYINMDMLGSSNYAYTVGDSDGSKGGAPGPAGSADLEAFFRQDFSDRMLPLLDEPLHFRSDYAAFDAAGIPFADISTGADGIKTTQQVTMFGGVAGEQNDPCYHLPCDDVDSIDMDAYEVMAKSISRSVQYFGIEGQGL